MSVGGNPVSRQDSPVSQELPILRSHVRVYKREPAYLQSKCQKALKNSQKGRGDPFSSLEEIAERLCQVSDCMIGCLQMLSGHLMWVVCSSIKGCVMTYEN